MDLLGEVGVWRGTVMRRVSEGQTRPSRAQYGDVIYTHMIEVWPPSCHRSDEVSSHFAFLLQILLYQDGLRYSRHHPVVQQAARRVINLFFECSCDYGPPWS